MNDALRREIIDSLRRSRKYANLCEDTLVRIADWAAARHQAPRPAIKAAKRKLHQVYGAYLNQLDLARVRALVAALPANSPQEAVRATCREILGCHASTAERLPIIERLYSELFSATGEPDTILDLACGLNPFALPWMSLAPDAQYFCFDIDQVLIGAINEFLGRVGRPPTAACADILVSPPEAEADVALLLKTSPCLEQQEQGATQRILTELPARHVVVSFPTRALGGRQKGMRQHYGRFMARLLGRLCRPARKLVYPSETLYVISR
jgi:16S rRNA (guanine(1405)-N(7))-methyltransferase